MLCTVFCYRQERFLTFLKLCGISLSTIALNCLIHLSWHRIEQVSLSLLSFPLWDVSFFITLVFWGYHFVKKLKFAHIVNTVAWVVFYKYGSRIIFWQSTSSLFIAADSHHLFDFYSMVSFKSIHLSIHSFEGSKYSNSILAATSEVFLGLESRLLGYW